MTDPVIAPLVALNVMEPEALTDDEDDDALADAIWVRSIFTEIVMGLVAELDEDEDDDELLLDTILELEYELLL